MFITNLFWGIILDKIPFVKEKMYEGKKWLHGFSKVYWNVIIFSQKGMLDIDYIE